MKKGIVVGCVDPRLHDVLPRAAEVMGVERVYMFRAAGPDGVWRDPSLAEEKKGTLAGVRRLSTLAPIDAIAFVGHTDCAGHCVSDEEHRQHVLEAAQALKSELEVEQPVFAIIAVPQARSWFARMWQRLLGPRQGSTADTDWSLEPLGTF